MVQLSSVVGFLFWFTGRVVVLLKPLTGSVYSCWFYGAVIVWSALLFLVVVEGVKLFSHSAETLTVSQTQNHFCTLILLNINILIYVTEYNY